MKYRTLLLAAALVCSTVNAELFVEDSFNMVNAYTNGTLNSQGPAISGMTGSWTNDNNALVSSTSLDYNDASYFPESGGRVSIGIEQDSGRQGRLLSSPYTDTSTNTVYLSFLMLTGTDSPGSYRAFELHDGGFADSANRQFQLGFQNGDFESGDTDYGFRLVNSDSLRSTLEANDQGVNLFVVKFEFSAENNADRVTVWQNPSLTSSDDPTDGVSFTGFNITFDRITFAKYGSSGEVAWDEIRLGDTFADVTQHGNDISTFSTAYLNWAADYGLTDEDAQPDADSLDHDGCDNLAEFALGMDPILADAGTRNYYYTTTEGDTNYFAYAYHRNSDYLYLGLTYSLIETPDLATPVADPPHDVEIGSPVDGYELVTARYLMDDPCKFIQLEVGSATEFNPWTVYATGYWAMDDGRSATAYDSSVNGFNGSVENVTSVSGMTGTALEFNGTNSAITLPAAAFDTIDQEITIAMWIYGAGSQPRNDTIFRAVNESGNRVLNIHLPYSNSTVYWDAGIYDVNKYDRINKTASAENYKYQWNHWAFTKNATTGTMSIYLNGALFHSGTGKTNSMAGITSVTLGSDGGTESYAGIIDDVFLFNQALSAEEVADLYNESFQEGDYYTLDAMYYVELPDGQAATTANPIQTGTVENWSTWGEELTVDPESILFSPLAGMGGAFNEQGGEAFMTLSETARQELAEALFNPETGAGLTLCRTAIGASDFGLSAYSYSEVSNDYTMAHFSIDRDTTSIIPFILAAQAENPELRMFASPWSPPAWMKVSGKMDEGDENPDDNVLIATNAIYDAYALYFSKYVQGYAANGVTIERIIVQNETDMNPGYPGCDMLPAQMSTLISDHIGPQFETDGLTTEIWAGSFRGKRDDGKTFMTLENAGDADGVGLQYATDDVGYISATYPDLAVMHTEGACEDGANSISQARDRFGEVIDWLYGGTENYCYWNMVLNETSASGWDWVQNSLVKVDRDTGVVTYNNDFAPMAIFGRFIRPGDRLLEVSSTDGLEAIAVENDEHLVVILQNNDASVVSRVINIAGRSVPVELPAESICAYVFKQ
jgi:glucosylceramidase